MAWPTCPRSNRVSAGSSTPAPARSTPAPTSRPRPTRRSGPSTWQRSPSSPSAAWRAARPLADAGLGQAPVRPGLLLGAVAGSGLGPAAVAGMGMSFERGRGLAFRTALLGTVVAVAGVVAAVTFGVSLRHLVDHPVEQGWNWDVVVGNPHNSEGLLGDPAAGPLHDEMVRLLATNRYVGSFSGFVPLDGITVDGYPVDLVAIERERGSVFQPIIEGRAPGS